MQVATTVAEAAEEADWMEAREEGCSSVGVVAEHQEEAEEGPM